MLDLEVVPESSLRHKKWEFILGMPIQQVIDIVKKQENLIKSVEFWYSDKVPFHMDLVLCMPQDGLKLHFDPNQQRLKIIEVYNMQKIILRYCSQCFNSPVVCPTMDEIDHTFGATKPPHQDTATGNLQLFFRGLSFLLSPQHPVGSQQPSASQLELVGGGGPQLWGRKKSAQHVVTKMSIYTGTNLPDTQIPKTLPVACFHGNVFLEKLEIIRDETSIKELVFNLIAEDLNQIVNSTEKTTYFSKTLRFGDTVQDVLSALGSPSRVFYKPDNKMKIHSPLAQHLIHTRNADYFYNYFVLGVDVLFDARSHRLKKFVLHTNITGHYNFNTYYRCLFEVKIPRQPLGQSPTGLSTITINSFTKWSEILSALGGDRYGGDPVILYRSGNENTRNPFPPTHCFGFKDMIFEILPSNEHIASVTLYQASKTQI